jgi:hypothetical protein
MSRFNPSIDAKALREQYAYPHPFPHFVIDGMVEDADLDVVDV